MFRLSTVVVFVGLSAPDVLAQYGRVEDGRLGDASLRVGSGGYNLPLKPNAPHYGDQIMSGNITRGRQFRGYSPISSTTDFGTAIGTSSLDDFRRDSIGVDDIRYGIPAYLPRPYYSPTRTVPSAGSVSVGFRPTGLPPLPENYLNQPLDPAQGKLGRSASEVRLFPRSNTPGPSRLTEANEFSNYNRPISRSDIFGVAVDPSKSGVPIRNEPGLPTFSGTMAQTSGLKSIPSDGSEGESGTGAQSATGIEPAVPPGSAFDRLVNRPSSVIGGQLPGGPPEIPDARPKGYGPQLTTQPALGMERRFEWAETGGAALPRAGGLGEVGVPGAASGDVYRAMQEKLRLSRQVAIVAESEDRQGSKGAERPVPAAGARPASPGELQAAPKTPLFQEQQDRVRAALEEPIVTFAGTERTLSNRALAQAEAHLSAGRYYDAVSSYDVARTADPENPLIWIGRGHSLIGAGDYLSAAASLEEGLARFPEIARFKVDLKKFLSHGDILDIRRADLERRLDEKDNYRLRFLLGYIEYYSGLTQFGLENLKKAAKAAPSTSPISKFPEMLAKR